MEPIPTAIDDRILGLQIFVNQVMKDQILTSKQIANLIEITSSLRTICGHYDGMISTLMQTTTDLITRLRSIEETPQHPALVNNQHDDDESNIQSIISSVSQLHKEFNKLISNLSKMSKKMASNQDWIQSLEEGYKKIYGIINDLKQHEISVETSISDHNAQLRQYVKDELNKTHQLCLSDVNSMIRAFASTAVSLQNQSNGAGAYNMHIKFKKNKLAERIGRLYLASITNKKFTNEHHPKRFLEKDYFAMFVNQLFANNHYFLFKGRSKNFSTYFSYTSPDQKKDIILIWLNTQETNVSNINKLFYMFIFNNGKPTLSIPDSVFTKKEDVISDGSKYTVYIFQNARLALRTSNTISYFRHIKNTSMESGNYKVISKTGGYDIVNGFAVIELPC